MQYPTRFLLIYPLAGSVGVWLLLKFGETANPAASAWWLALTVGTAIGVGVGWAAGTSPFSDDGRKPIPAAVRVGVGASAGLLAIPAAMMLRASEPDAAIWLVTAGALMLPVGFAAGWAVIKWSSRS